MDAYVKEICGIDDEEDITLVGDLEEISVFLDSLARFSDLSPEKFCADKDGDLVVESAESPDLTQSRVNISREWTRFLLTEQQGDYEQWSAITEDIGPFAQSFDLSAGDFQSKLKIDGLQVISIAAAGNASKRDENLVINYPFFPGALDNVVSVSALNLGEIGNVSNYGEIAMNGVHPADEPEQGAWTSFAAPRLSAYAAIHLAQGGSSPCGSHPGIFPPLGYVPEIVESYDNLHLDVAASEYCEGFLNRE